MNPDLPPMPFWHARSFYAMILALIATLLNTFNVNLDTLLLNAGIPGAGTQTELINSVMLLAPYVFALWAYLERRSPKKSLTL